MRQLYSHHIFATLNGDVPISDQTVSSATDALKIVVADAPGVGGAHHRYEITGFDSCTNPSHYPADAQRFGNTILFQNGTVTEHGPNGITIEVLLAIAEDQLQCFQNGPFSSDYNARALHHIQQALTALHERTRNRITRNVEGKLTS